MSILSWNCRGLRTPRSVLDLHQLVKETRPILLFLMETEVKKRKLELLHIKFSFERLITVETIGKGGGLALLWKDNKEVEVLNFSLRHISAKITLLGSDFQWKMTGFYEHPNRLYRDASWQLLTYLASVDSLPWLCLGDFNEVVTNSEKRGGTIRNASQMERFRNAIEDCNLGDLGYIGSKYTWCNGRGPREFIKERLDMGLATQEWCNNFLEVVLEVLAARSADHKPLWIRFCPNSLIRAVPRRFKYETAWNMDKACAEVIKRGWNKEPGGDVSLSVAKSWLESCQEALIEWSKASFGNTYRKIKKLSAKLEWMQRNEEAARQSVIKLIQ